MEIGSSQANEVKGILEGHGWKQVRVYQDLAGNDRVISAGKGTREQGKEDVYGHV